MNFVWFLFAAAVSFTAAHSPTRLSSRLIANLSFLMF